MSDDLKNWLSKPLNVPPGCCKRCGSRLSDEDLCEDRRICILCCPRAEWDMDEEVTGKWVVRR